MSRKFFLVELQKRNYKVYLNDIKLICKRKNRQIPMIPSFWKDDDTCTKSEKSNSEETEMEFEPLIINTTKADGF